MDGVEVEEGEKARICDNFFSPPLDPPCVKSDPFWPIQISVACEVVIGSIFGELMEVTIFLENLSSQSGFVLHLTCDWKVGTFLPSQRSPLAFDQDK